MPSLYIITGSNGAGKSSVGFNYVPQHLRTSIFDGDKLFMEKSKEFWRNGIKSHKECKKLAAEHVDKAFDDLVDKALKTKEDFAYEGHFTNDATWLIPQKFREVGFEIHLIFFGLIDTSLSETRVTARSKEGGHYVDPFTVASNFYGNLEKLDKYFSMFHSMIIVDTSEVEHKGLTEFRNGSPYASIPSKELPAWVVDNLKVITKMIIQKEYKTDTNN